MANPDSGPHGCCIFIDEETGLAYDAAGVRVPEEDIEPERERG